MSIFMVFSAFLEMMSVAAIFPFIAILSQPNFIQTNSKLFFIYHWFNFSNPKAFNLFFGGLVLGMLIVSNLCSALTTWKVLNFANMQEHELSHRLLNRYLYMPYEFFLETNSIELVKNIFSEVSLIVNDLIISSLRFLAKFAVTVAIIFFLVIFNLTLALIFLCVFIVIYLGLGTLINKFVAREGEKRIQANTLRYKIASEALYAIQDVKLMKLENFILNKFDLYSKPYAQARALTMTIAEIPRYFIEVVAFGSILVFLIFAIGFGNSMTQIVPILATYAYAGMRLMPALHAMHSARSSIKFGLLAVQALRNDLIEMKESQVPEFSLGIKKLYPEKEIRFDNVSYAYREKKRVAVNSLMLRIPAKSFFCIVGETGAGKTTLINLLLGLLKPQSGKIFVDSEEMANNVYSWQSCLGYVPQHIYLTDDSIAENIAFGCSKEDINYQQLSQVMEIACLKDFIESLPDKHNTLVGDRGVRLSGGQRQRIGIARALYRVPEVLILDEATSALDNATEEKIMTNLKRALREKTVVMIAHRVSTIKFSDAICMLCSDGQVAGVGSYNELLVGCSEFKSLLRIMPTVEYEAVF